MESADDYNQKVIILIEAVIIQLQQFEIDIDRDTIRNTIAFALLRQTKHLVRDSSPAVPRRKILEPHALQRYCARDDHTGK